METVRVNEGGGPVEIQSALGPGSEYIHLGNGLYRSKSEEDWAVLPTTIRWNIKPWTEAITPVFPLTTPTCIQCSIPPARAGQKLMLTELDISSWPRSPR